MNQKSHAQVVLGVDPGVGESVSVYQWWQRDPPMHGIGLTLDDAIKNAKPCRKDELPGNKNITCDKPYAGSPSLDDLEFGLPKE